jgi:RHS repeat-associated protein
MSYLSSTYTYDQENRLSSTAGMSYTYDGNGERVLKSNTNTGAAVKRYWSMGGNTLAEGDGSGTLTAEYVYFGGKRIARIDLPANTVHYYLSDHLGSTSMVASAAGTIEEESDFYPFGTEMIVTGPGANELKFTGKRRDTESQLDYYGARYYSNAFGRFPTPDWSDTPSAVPYAKLDNPQSLNLYAYLGNNPLNRIDQDGHCWSWAQGACNFFQKAYHGVFTDYGFKTNAQVTQVNEENRQWLIQQHVVTPDKNGNTIDWNKASASQIRTTYSAVVGQLILRLIHGPGTISGAAMDSVRKMSTEEIINSLKNGEEPGIIKPDGTVMNGNTRLAVLQERGVDINKLGLKPDAMYEEFNATVEGTAAEPSMGEEAIGSEEPTGSTSADPEEPPL